MMINQDQISHYRRKLQYEIDSWDLHTSLEKDPTLPIKEFLYSNATTKNHGYDFYRLGNLSLMGRFKIPLF